MSTKTVVLRWLTILTIFCAGLISCLNLTINDNALDLLPEDVVSEDIQKLKEMGLVDRVFITLTQENETSDSSSSTELLASAGRLGQYLAKSDLFTFVLYRMPGGYESGVMNLVSGSLPFLLEADDYTVLQEKISPEGVASGLKQTFNLLNSPAGLGLKKHLQRDPLSFIPLGLGKLSYLRSEFSLSIDNGFFLSKDDRSCLLIAEAAVSLTDSKGALAVSEFLDSAYSKALPPDVKVTVIGSLPHTLANARTIQGDLKVLLPVATFLLLTLLGLALRSVKGVLVFIIPFLAATPAIGLTSMIYGELSRLALGFGIVLLGIAVDFSVHLYLGQKEGCGGGTHRFHHLRRPIFFATLTTSAVFIILMFSGVPSHRQMATLALFGVLLAVVFSWILVPTIGQPKYLAKKVHDLYKKKRYHSKTIFFLWGLLLCAGAFSWPQLHYNGDLRVLDVPDADVIEDEQLFSTIWGDKGEQAFIVVEAESLEKFLTLNTSVFQILKDQLEFQFQSLAPILPGKEVEVKRLRRWNEFWEENKQEFAATFKKIAIEQGYSENAFSPFFKWLEEPPRSLDYHFLRSGPMGALIQSLVKEGGEGSKFYGLTTVDMQNGTVHQLNTAIDDIQGVTIIANEKWRSAVEAALRHDVLTLSTVAGVVIVIIAVIQFQGTLLVFAVLAPVLSALSAMSLFSLVTTGELNMMHLIMGIMVIGLSVDYGIFTVCSREEKDNSTAVAVTICAASSLIGFGVLAFAHHPALHALGTTVLAGIGMAWPTAVLVSPAILNMKGRG